MNGTTQQHRKPRTKPRTACHRNLQPHSKFLSTNDIFSIFCYDSQSQPIYDSNPLPSQISLNKTNYWIWWSITTSCYHEQDQSWAPTAKSTRCDLMKQWLISLMAKIQQMRFCIRQGAVQCKLLNQNREKREPKRIHGQIRRRKHQTRQRRRRSQTSRTE